MNDMDDTRLQELARATALWMQEIGAVHDDERKSRSYVSSGEWAEEFGLTYSVSECDIGEVVQAAHALGLWIAFEPFKGWYLSQKPSDAASVVTRLINYMCSLSETVSKYLAAQYESGRMLEITPGYKGRLRVTEIDEIAPLLTAAGVEVANDVKIALLEAKDRFGQEQ